MKFPADFNVQDCNEATQHIGAVPSTTAAAGAPAWAARQSVDDREHVLVEIS